MAPPVIVASGLPRSGTSLMMQMLAAGGIPLLTDGLRPPDLFNPHGYWEYEPVKRIAKDASWLSEAVGCAVKVVCPLVLALPPGNYRVILMKREFSATASSQLKMLGQPANLEVLLRRAFTRSEEFLRGRTDIDLLVVDYGRVLSAPMEVSMGVEDFLKCPLNTASMAAVVKGESLTPLLDQIIAR